MLHLLDAGSSYFEIEELKSDETWASCSRTILFKARSPADIERWLCALQAAPQAPQANQEGHVRLSSEAPGPKENKDCGRNSHDNSPYNTFQPMRTSFGVEFSPLPATTSVAPNATSDGRVHDKTHSTLIPPVAPPPRTSLVFRPSFIPVPCVSGTAGAVDGDEALPSESDESLSTASHDEASECGDDSAEESQSSVSRFRQIFRNVRTEARLLDQELKEAECAARMVLRFFDEVPTGGALEALHRFFCQLAQFAKEFGAAARKVQQEQ